MFCSFSSKYNHTKTTSLCKLCSLRCCYELGFEICTTPAVETLFTTHTHTQGGGYKFNSLLFTYVIVSRTRHQITLDADCETESLLELHVLAIFTLTASSMYGAQSCTVQTPNRVTHLCHVALRNAKVAPCDGCLGVLEVCKCPLKSYNDIFYI